MPRDIVLVGNTHKTPKRIHSLPEGEYCICYHSSMEDGRECYDWLNPLPITEEILKANGFERNTLHYDDNNVVFYNPETSYLQIYSLILGQQKPKVNIYIRFVHELQHALRLCGLTDLADNFKLQA